MSDEGVNIISESNAVTTTLAHLLLQASSIPSVATRMVRLDWVLRIPDLNPLCEEL